MQVGNFVGHFLGISIRRSHVLDLVTMKEEQGFSLIELLLVVTVIGLITAFVIPSLSRSKMAANEGSAIQSMRGLISAQLNYSVTRGTGYASDVGMLQTTGLIDDVLGSGTKDGYTFVVIAGVSGDTFTVDAKPVTYGTTGSRYFCSDEGGGLYVSLADDCSTEGSPPVGGGKKKGK